MISRFHAGVARCLFPGPHLTARETGSVSLGDWAIISNGDLFLVYTRGPSSNRNCQVQIDGDEVFWTPISRCDE